MFFPLIPPPLDMYLVLPIFKFDKLKSYCQLFVPCMFLFHKRLSLKRPMKIVQFPKKQTKIRPSNILQD